MQRSLHALTVFVLLAMLPLLAHAAPRAWLDRDSIRLVCRPAAP